jgi:hypothetical protein
MSFGAGSYFELARNLFFPWAFAEGRSLVSFGMTILRVTMKRNEKVIRVSPIGLPAGSGFPDRVVSGM